MNDDRADNFIPELPDFGEYSLDPILTEYRQAQTAPRDDPYGPDERIRRIVMEALDDTIKKSRPADAKPPAFDEPPASWLEPEQEPEQTREDEPEQEPQDDGETPPEADFAGEPEPAPETASPEPDGGEDAPPVIRRRTAELAEQKERPFAERLRAPLIRFMATKAAKKAMREAEGAAWPEPDPEDSFPEPPAKKAAKYYAGLVPSLRLRGRIALGLCAVSAWVGFGLPCFGLLGGSPAAKAGVCLLLQLAVMMACLDVFSAGLRQLLELRPCAEALTALSCVLTCFDAVTCMTGGSGLVPFCTLSSLGLCVCLWGQRQLCVANAVGMRCAAGKSASVLARQDVGGDGGLIRARRSAAGFVRRAEEPDASVGVYRIAAPVIILAALGLAAAAAFKKPQFFLHVFSALLCVGTGFTAGLPFCLPYVLTARRLARSGAALAGWSGSRDIARDRRVVLTDDDLFPAGTTALSGINIQDSVKIDKVVSYAVSILTAADCGAKNALLPLMERRKYPLVKVEDLKRFQAGGFSAYVHSERVLVGSLGFMTLMGIHAPLNMEVNNAVCVAFGDELVGIFNVKYDPDRSVRQALTTMQSGRTQPVYAARDFNVNPSLMAHVFGIPAERFVFPSFEERYRVSAAVSKSAPVCAVLTRPGMLPAADAAEYGRRLYGSVLVNTVLTLLGCGLGMILLFLLFFGGSFDTASVLHVFAYLAVWAVPLLLLSIWQSR